MCNGGGIGILFDSKNYLTFKNAVTHLSVVKSTVYKSSYLLTYLLTCRYVIDVIDSEAVTK